jgi:hypothetical protein
MLTKSLVLLLALAAAASGQTISHGEQIIPWSASLSLNVTFAAAFVTLTGNVTSITPASGSFGGQSFELTLCQGTGGPYTVPSTWSITTGATAIATTGCTRFRLVWDDPSSTWVSTAEGVSAANQNGWAINTNNTLLYAEASSMTRAPHASGSPVGTILSGGGLSGNYIYLLAASPWGSGHTTYYNDSCDGSTTTQMLARYTTGSTTCTSGITVPAAHTVVAANTTAGNRSFYFIGLDACNNDQNSSIALSTTISNVEALIADAQADGATVVLMTSPAANFGGCVTLNQDAINGTLGSIGPNLMIAPLNQWLPNEFNITNFDPVGPHPTVAGHLKVAANLTAMMVGAGALPSYEAGYNNTPVCVQYPDSSTQTVCLNTDGTITAPNGATINSVKMSNVPLLTWATAGGCSVQYAYCAESGQWTPDSPIIVKKIQVYMNTAPAGCTNAGTLWFAANAGPIATIPLVNGTQSYTVTGPWSVAAGNVLTIQNSSTAATGCSTYASSFGTTVEYIMQ